ncbi:GTP 3',8-cyclase MoaA [Diaphorobacter ruginosibacter]|uniref:GTP 3',8-cyclase n=1 Tax=Diaphorobacter ruginosibacter TaxID=1715720 RepID=A0A7G9RT93_9BURK|nr:GTP 3',8-cyclase MoaA [Diaphorobacter ruginosibacter]QNN58818.1 GTP 3',8-cyclase MoaA [Diaphorobacter ruginosibacter]
MHTVLDHAEPVAQGLSVTPILDARGRPLRDLRLSVIDQCNFRCTYCMPRETFGPDYPFLPADQRMSLDQMFTLAKAFAELGVGKIRLTGGEPLLRRGIESLVERLAGLRTLDGRPMEIALTTNGTLLAEKARALRDAGLTRVTVSLDALDDALFRRMAGTQVPVARVLEGIAAASAAGLAPVKVNTVVERGANEGQIVPLVRFFKGTGVTLRFIEYMDVGGADAWSSSKVVTAREVHDRVASEFALTPMDGDRDGATAILVRHADGGGEVGFIASVSQPFCGDCSRARVSSDGQLFTCLFATQGLDLRPWLESGGDGGGDSGGDAEGLQSVIRGHWSRRGDRYSELRSARSARPAGSKAYPVVRMSLVGG